MKSQKRQLRSYQLVSFVNEIDKEGKRAVECVPSSWVSYDKGLGSLVVRYMAPPYKEEDKLLIRTLIQNREDPPESWPSYPVTLQGDASKALTLLQIRLTMYFHFFKLILFFSINC